MFMPLPARLLTSTNYLRMIIKSYFMKISPNPIKNHQPVSKIYKLESQRNFCRI